MTVRVISFFSLWFFFCLVQRSHAQDAEKIVQLSGVVLNRADSSKIAGAHVYVPKSGRGATSNYAGYFSLPVLPGDSVVISYVGYKIRHYNVPDISGDFITIRVTMSQDVTLLDDVEIVSLPTEDAFKEAVLALNVPMDNGLSAEVLNMRLFSIMRKNLTMGAYSNYKFYMDQYPSQINDQFRGRTIPFLDPLRWYRFIRDMKKKKDKK